MRSYTLLFLGAFLISACTEKQKKFEGITAGMTKEEVISRAGEPGEKNNILLAELWVYADADRTVVFRGDTVYDIITSASARVDSIEATLKETGRDVKEKLWNTGDTIDSASLRIKNKIMSDSAGNN